VKQRVLSRAAESGLTEPTEALFHHIRTQAKGNPETWAKMEAFLARYGFFRNMSFGMLVGFLLLAISAICHRSPEYAFWAAGSLAGAIGCCIVTLSSSISIHTEMP